jgi:6-phosphogluconolactonase
MSRQIRWHRFPDSEAVAAEAVRRILDAARAAIADHGEFRIVLAGGGTPQKAYESLAGQNADWPHWHIYLGDERCLPRDDAERNSVMIARAWLDCVKVPTRQIHWIAAERGAQAAAVAYESVIREALPFDLVLLGMGEDGHTASLFPGQAHDPERLVVPVSQAPKPPPERVSLNYPALNQCRSLLLMATGAAKRAALERWRGGAALPVNRLRCGSGIDVLMDEAAAARLE